MMRRFTNIQIVLAAVAAVALLLPAAGALAKKKKGARYGLEGRIVSYDEGRGVLVVKVVKTRVSGGAGAGRVAGKPAPKKSFKRGAKIEFGVVPSGSVLKRTVVKNKDGGGLDTSGTKEGFVKALSMIPEDSNVVFSFERADKAEVKAGRPEWDLRIIQLRLSEEEIEARWKEQGDEG